MPNPSDYDANGVRNAATKCFEVRATAISPSDRELGWMGRPMDITGRKNGIRVPDEYGEYSLLCCTSLTTSRLRTAGLELSVNQARLDHGRQRLPSVIVALLAAAATASDPQLQIDTST